VQADTPRSGDDRALASFGLPLARFGHLTVILIQCPKRKKTKMTTKTESKTWANTNANDKTVTTTKTRRKTKTQTKTKTKTDREMGEWKNSTGVTVRPHFRRTHNVFGIDGTKQLPWKESEMWLSLLPQRTAPVDVARHNMYIQRP